MHPRLLWIIPPAYCQICRKQVYLQHKSKHSFLRRTPLTAYLPTDSTERAKEHRRGSYFFSGALFSCGTYRTCAMKLPIFSVTFCCICRVACLAGSCFSSSTASCGMDTVELLQVAGSELIQRDIPDGWDDMLFDVPAIVIHGGWADMRFGVELIPAPQPCCGCVLHLLG